MKHMRPIVMVALLATGCTINLPSNLVQQLTPSPRALPSELPVTVTVTPRPKPSQTPITIVEPPPPSPSVPVVRPTLLPSPVVPSPSPLPGSADVTLNYVSSLAVDGQGRVYLMEEYGKRIWRRDPSGELVLVIDSADKRPDGIKDPSCVAVDHLDRLLVLDAGRVLRQEADGSVKVLAEGLGGRGGYLAAGQGDEVWVVDTYTWDTNYRLYHVLDGQSQQVAQVELGADAYLWGFGVDDQGTLYGRLRGEPQPKTDFQAGGVFKLDPQTGKPAQRVADAQACLDATGRIYDHMSGAITTTRGGKSDALGSYDLPTDHVVYDEQTGTLYTSNYYAVLAGKGGGPLQAIAGTGKPPS